MNKPFIDKLDDPAEAWLLSVTKCKSGWILEALAFICYLPADSRNAKELIPILEQAADLQTEFAIKIIPDRSQRHGFSLSFEPAEVCWINLEGKRFEQADLAEDPEESWKLADQLKKLKKTKAS